MGSSNSNNISRRPEGPIHFGPFNVTTQVFLTTPLSFALVNLKPLLPGHVLVCPRTLHKRLTDLSADELTDLFGAVQRVQRMLARYYFSQPQPQDPTQTDAEPEEISAQPPAAPEAGSFNIAIQDGAEAGQTVPHVHVHVIPRIRGSTAKETHTEGDAIYELMAAEAGNVGGALWDKVIKSRPQPGGGFPRVEDPDRMARSMAEMEAEADAYRGVLASMGVRDGR
ncbi:HIT domain-containing protein [Xylaria bambusicola]|uniref:HIT domain-containing protein n=1 Tax=Xylaria bambusicola TaxID=326684 RepID=UPI002007BEFF|nr:HIT domain-containing protein [Xylaria bambusicola]KAI0514747.1 HIT domain-containing protein [Xylaria bambusicola]